MGRFFETKNKVVDALGKFCDFVIVGILFIVTSIPILTVFSSASAVYYTTLKCFKEDRAYPAKTYFDYWKKNVGQGIVLELVFLAYGALCLLEILLVDNYLAEGLLPAAFGVIRWLLLIPAVMALPWAVTYQTRFSDSLWRILKNSLLLAVSCLGKTFLAVLGIVLACVVTRLFVPALPFLPVPLSFFLISILEPVYGLIIEGKTPSEDRD